MRRLVAISNKTSKIIAVAVALTIALTSIHLAATARIATLRQQREQLEQAAVSTQQAAVSNQPSAPSQLTIPVASEKTGLSAKPLASAAGGSATPARQRQIVISIVDRRLAVMDSGRVMKIYPIAVGARATPSPDGDFVIVNRAKDPTYRHGETEIAPGKDNPLGSRWMGLNLKGYGIHGTNVQNSIGKAASHGCFRLRKQDVEELYGLMQVGDTVTIRRERDAMIALVFATPGSAPAAVSAQAVKAQSNSEVQMASATATASVETTQQ